MMRTLTRRSVLGSTTGMTMAGLSRPSIAQGNRGGGTLRFIPLADVTILDPLTTTAYPTRNHGHMCWDTLYGVDEHFVPQPQLAEGYALEDGGKRWVFTLRDGPLFHDGEKVRALDAVASIQRWMLRDTQGQTLAQRLDEIRSLDDRRFEIRLKTPFGSLLDALAKPSSYPCFVFPERFARQDPTKALTEVIGSGPYRFVAQERVPGSLVVYQKFDRYVPTPVGQPSMIAGPKVAGFERMEWKVIPDGSTAAAAMQSGEADWWEAVPNDLEPLMRSTRSVTTSRVDQVGSYTALRFNQLLPPFDDPAARQALLSAVDQSDFMQSFAGTDRSAWRDGVGFFPAISPFASDAGMSALTGPRNPDAAKAAIALSGHGGTSITTLHATDAPQQNACMSVAVDLLGRAGFNVNDLTIDFGMLVQRRMNKGPGQGSWNVLIAIFGGADLLTPASNFLLRGNGQNAWFGWPEAPQLEQLRESWFDAPDRPAQKAIARSLQEQAFKDVPYIPLGEFFYPTAYRSDLTGVRNGMVLPLNARRAT